MIHLTLAIADFMMILIMAALGAMGWIVAAAAGAGAIGWGMWRLVRGRRRPRG
ncbi:MAG TPA: hypothetical protein VF649_11195 [Sphingomonas sp.]|jgi:hypothetical protein|uniref:hypothetical protein n=1 Tax=Sphingomonas sp. TaxID=28214 RepID=UPI002ED9CB1D